jgi:hypothetical protein
MSKKARKDDLNALAFEIAQQATGQGKPEPSTKNPAAVALGRLGGLKGGKSRASKMTADERRIAAIKAARARWGKTPPHEQTT